MGSEPSHTQHLHLIPPPHEHFFLLGRPRSLSLWHSCTACRYALQHRRFQPPDRILGIWQFVTSEISCGGFRATCRPNWVDRLMQIFGTTVARDPTGGTRLQSTSVHMSIHMSILKSTFLFVCPCTGLYTCLYTYLYTYLYTCLYTWWYTFLYICPYACLCTRMACPCTCLLCVYTRAFTPVYGMSMPISTQVDAHVCTHAHARDHTHVCIHFYAHVCTYVYTQVYTHVV